LIVAVHQPQYLPWIGYFDKMRRADVFCYLDDVQYKKNEWQNRNRIKTAQDWQWLTVPVRYRFPEKIKTTAVRLILKRISQSSKKFFPKSGSSYRSSISI
jgi:hypothetical protein